MRGSRSLGLALVAAALGVAPAMAQQSNAATAPAQAPPAANSEMQPAHNNAAMQGANTHTQPGSTTAATDQSQPAASSSAPANTAATEKNGSTAPAASAANATPPAAEHANLAPANTAATTSEPVARTTAENKGPSGSLQKYNGEWRSSKLVGATVYNNHGDDIGKIDDLLMNDQGKVETVVISTGGTVLGIGAKLVSVPFDQIKFEPSVTHATAVTAGTPGSSHPTGTRAANDGTPNEHSVVLPGATEKSLSQQSTFKYASSD